MYILTVLWQLSNHLASETVFSKENIKRLSKIAYAGLIESGIYAVAVLSALLAYIFKLANRLKDEKDI
ncbi:DUF2975 domain-containing protein [Vagococcus jeotgali]|uniref:DUF2975 domain-containing protein n=1 Tax=Vagococcus jeotgali TaxID=3109030 RepID=UPI002DDA0E26|nr:DUF2975 domain-containing protein [Vagococcus sp. B2T-5]